MPRVQKSKPTRPSASIGIKKRCDNCPKFFVKVRRTQHFCCAQCRKEFHRFGAGYGPIKQALEKLVDKLTAQRVKMALDQHTRISEALSSRLQSVECSLKPILVEREQAASQPTAQ